MHMHTHTHKKTKLHNLLLDKFRSVCPYWWTVCQKNSVISLLYTFKLLMTLLFFYSNFCFYTLLTSCRTLSFFLASHTLRLQNFVPVHKLTFFKMFLLWAAQTLLMFKFMLLYSSLIVFWYSVTAVLCQHFL